MSGPVILGAGPTGIGAGLRLLSLGIREFVILEASEEVGGLSRSVTDDAGFTWDLGGHVFFSRNEPFARALTGIPLPRHERRSSVLLGGRRVAYPVQANVGGLPARLALAAARPLLLRRREAGRDLPFEAWCRTTFGDPLTEAFFLPYNRKAWGVDPSLLDSRWIAPAVQIPRRAEILRSLLGIPGPRWGMNATFSYPRDGGCGSVWSALAAPLAGRIVTGARAVAIATDRRVVVTADGREWPYEWVVSSLPLPELVGLLRPAATDILPQAASLRANRIRVTGLGLTGSPPPRPWSWVYLPDPAVPFYRISFLSSYSPSLVPEPGRNWSLLAETTLSGGPPPDPRAIAEAAAAHGFLPPGASVASTFVRDLPVAYPLPLLGRFATLEKLHAHLDGLDIRSRGRFGGWLYEASSMDSSFLMGWEAAEAGAGGGPERLMPSLLGGRLSGTGERPTMPPRREEGDVH